MLYFLLLAGAAGIGYLLAKNSASDAAPALGDGGTSGDASTKVNQPGDGSIDQTGKDKSASDPSTTTEPPTETPPVTTAPPVEPIPNDSVYPFIAVTTSVKGTGGAPVQIFVAGTDDPAIKATEMDRVSYALAQYINAKKLDSKSGIAAYKASLSPVSIDPSTDGPPTSLYNATKAETAPGAGFYVFFIKDWAVFLDHPVGSAVGLPAEIIAYTATRAAVVKLATPDSGLGAVVFPTDLA